jgi:hypothetical protein
MRFIILILIVLVSLNNTVFAGSPEWADWNLPEIKSPVAGEHIASNSSAIIDFSNSTEGFIIVSYTGGSSNDIIVRITKDGKRIGHDGNGYLYRINNNGTSETIVLSEGNGVYTVCILRRSANGSATTILTQRIEVSLRHEFLPFLQPNKYVNYTTEGAVADLATQLLRDCPRRTTIATFNYVSRNIRYDFALVENGIPYWYEPNLEELLEVTRMGVCFDFASLMTAVLRLNNIPTKMIFGWAQVEGEERFFHAWVNVYLPDYGWVFFDPTLRVGDLRFMPANPIRGKTSISSLDYLSFEPLQFF